MIEAKLEEGDYVFMVLNTTEGELKVVQKIKKVYVNTVLFENGEAASKYILREINEWISVYDYEPDSEVIATGYQNEQLIGFIGREDEDDEESDFTCESEGTLLQSVTHWRPKPFPPYRYKK